MYSPEQLTSFSSLELMCKFEAFGHKLLDSKQIANLCKCIVMLLLEHKLLGGCQFGSGASFCCSSLAKARAQRSATTLANTDASDLVRKIWKTAHVEVKLVYAQGSDFHWINFATYRS